MARQGPASALALMALDLVDRSSPGGPSRVERYLPLIGALGLSDAPDRLRQGTRAPAGRRSTWSDSARSRRSRPAARAVPGGLFRAALGSRCDGSGLARFGSAPCRAWLGLPRAGDYVAPGRRRRRGLARLVLSAERPRPGAARSPCVFSPCGARSAREPGAVRPSAGLTLLVAGVLRRVSPARVRHDSRVVCGCAHSPWDNAVRGGAQVAQAIQVPWPAGGLFGTGLGLGDTATCPPGIPTSSYAALGGGAGAVGLLARRHALRVDRMARLSGSCPRADQRLRVFSPPPSRCFACCPSS